MCGAEAAETYALDAGLRAPAERDIGLAVADEPRAIAERLDAGGAGGHRRADRAPETVTNGNLPACKIYQKGWNGEGRELAHATGIGRACRRHHGLESADSGR